MVRGHAGAGRAARKPMVYTEFGHHGARARRGAHEGITIVVAATCAATSSDRSSTLTAAWRRHRRADRGRVTEQQRGRLASLRDAAPAHDIARQARAANPSRPLASAEGWHEQIYQDV